MRMSRFPAIKCSASLRQRAAKSSSLSFWSMNIAMMLSSTTTSDPRSGSSTKTGIGRGELLFTHRIFSSFATNRRAGRSVKRPKSWSVNPKRNLIDTDSMSKGNGDVPLVKRLLSNSGSLIPYVHRMRSTGWRRITGCISSSTTRISRH